MMATKRQTTTPTASPPNPSTTAAASAADDLGIGAPPSSAPAAKASQHGSPIGVPQYATDSSTGEIATYDVPVIDPSTGKQAIGANGQPLTTKQPVPWEATRSFTIPQRFGPEDAGQSSYGVMPKYYAGDVEAILYSMPPEQLANLQALMTDVGLYGSKNPNITYRIADKDTISAFQQVLTAANATGLTYDAVLQNWKDVSKLQPPAPPKPHITTVTNTDDLLAVFKTASRSALGRELSDSEARQYAATFQAQEKTYQGTQNAATDAGQSASVMAPPSPSTFLDAQVQQANPSEYGANRFANTFDTFQQLLRGPSA